MKHLKSIDKNIEKSLLNDIEDIQWSANNDTFHLMVKQLERKYCENKSYSEQALSALKIFFSYFKDVWVNSEEFMWYEGAHPFGSSNNQGIEGKNRDIKASQTFRKRMPLGSFIDTCLMMCHEWSLEDNSLLGADRRENLFAKPDGLKTRSAGYDWYMNHKTNNNYVRIPAKNFKTMLQNVSTIYAVPSSNTSLSESSLKDLAKERLKTRFNLTDISSFDECMRIRKSCYLVEQVNNDFYCDCAMGSKARQCKHSVGLMFKTEILEIDSDVRSKPLGQKRKRGRPKKLPSCLTRSPEQASVRSLVTSVTTPDVSLLSSTIIDHTIEPASTNSTIHSPISVMSNQRKRMREIETQVDLDSPSPPPPAKRISKQKIQITFCDSPENILNIPKRTLRSKKTKN